MSLWDILVLLAVGGLTAAALKRLRRKKASGCACGSCGGCPGCAGCAGEACQEKRKPV